MKPIACDLTAFDATERRRYDTLRAELARARQDMRETADGYTLCYRDDEATYRALAEWIALERRCCPFLAFTLRVEPDGGPLAVTLGGGDEVKRFLKSQLAR